MANGDGPETGKAASIRVIGGLIAIVAALVAIAFIALYAISRSTKGLDSPSVSVATSAFGVIGSVIGAYVGVKVGADQAKTQSANAAGAAAKAAVFAAHVPEDKAAEIAALAEKQAKSATARALGRFDL